ncbi:PD-(D/E)XK nuclease family protein [Aliikangiella sp. IMCC44359]|uniref:PD-(D/E)XK nuclease family protein n=1 Tax=Aliikangiella sp. IMCC44359 TaxID=3459125 RepID=UPI00403A8F3B
MPITIDFANIAKQLNSKTLILTPNSRTQKAIIAGFVEQLAEGEVVYSPNVMSFSQWQEFLWSELSFIKPSPGRIGNLELKTWLKAQIIADEKWQLTNSLGVAEKVLEAYRILNQWGLQLSDLGTLETIENRYFLGWTKALEDFLKEANLIPSFSLLNSLLQHSKYLVEHIPPKLLLVGFNQLTPIEKLWFNQCEQQGCEVIQYYPTREVQSTKRIALSDLKHELEYAAELSLIFSKEQPECSIGIVVHQLSNYLEIVHQVFSERFQPEEFSPWQPLEKVKYNVSAGQSLIDMPMVYVAVKILSLKTSGFDLQTLLLLKNSPFIDWGENVHSIKRFLHTQSLLAYKNYTLERLQKAIANDSEREYLSLLNKRITEIQQRGTKPRPMTAWVDLWKECLKTWGWLNNRDLDNSEQKQLSEFYTALNESIQLSLIYSKSTGSEAKEFLKQTLRQKSFQLPSDRTNVHILGVLEATGLEFDQLFLVGFERNSWPQKAKFNPFLPIAFQQKHDMPGSSAEREYFYAKDLSDSLMNSASYLWVTQTRREDGSQSCSPFFENISLSVDKNIQDEETGLKVNPDYVWRKDEHVSISVGDVSGGAYLLSQYASCPFKAMSNFHFNLNPPQKIQKGIDAKIKGAWLHAAMELLWLNLKGQEKLLELTQVEIEELIKQVLTTTQNQLENQLYAVAPKLVIELEFNRLFDLINEWLEIEKSKAPFNVQTEVEKKLSLGPLTFKFRVDRIDTEPSGMLEIIDYKTGSCHVKKWLGQRPEEAQMPAYVLACQPESVKSLSYAKLKTGEVSQAGVWFDNNDEFHFMEIDAHSKKDKTKSLLSDASLIEAEQPLIKQWQKNLEAMAKKIAEGEMPVSPKSRVDSCHYCDFSDFCRINEAQPEDLMIDEKMNSQTLYQDKEQS